MYYGRRRYRSWRSRAQAPSKYIHLYGLFGDAVSDIRQAFLELDKDALDEMFADYEQLHGASAAQYARKTYPAWKRGTTNLSGQTMERLVELVPPYLSAEQRFSLLEKLTQKHKTKPTQHSIRIDTKNPQPGLTELDNLLAKLTVEDRLANIPPPVMEAAKWLYDDDMTAARAVLAEVMKIDNDLLKATTVKELALLRKTIISKQIKSASYRVELPSGIVQVVVYTKSFCFVSDACFGHASTESAYLRQFRDERLLSTPIGVMIVVFYYNVAPLLCRLLQRMPMLKPVVRQCLQTAIVILKVSGYDKRRGNDV